MNILAINANGILGKIDSFDTWLQDIYPSMFVIQETKVPTTGKIKSEYLKFYELYELIRSNNPGQGAGLCIGVNKNINSALPREGDDDTECLTVSVDLGHQKLIMVTGYGPQESTTPDIKAKFWAYLDNEVDEAERNENILIIQMDSNSWLGSNVIPGDPNPTNNNGKYFLSFLERNHNITLVNSLKVFTG